jgi:hypothetical protein
LRLQGLERFSPGGKIAIMSARQPRYVSIFYFMEKASKKRLRGVQFAIQWAN